MVDVAANIEGLAKDFVAKLTLPEKRHKIPIAIILIGIPASGKSYLSVQVASNFPFVSISENNLASYLAAHNPDLQVDRNILLEFARLVIKKIAWEKANSIFDANLKTFVEREQFRKTIKEAGGEALTVYLEIPQSISFSRIQKRNQKILDGELKGTIMNWDYFLYEVNTTQIPRKKEKAVTIQMEKRDSLKNFLLRLLKILKGKTIAQ